MKHYFILNDTRTNLHHGCEVVMNNLYSLIQKNNPDARFSKLCTGQTISEEKWHELLEDVDVVIINGEGTLHDAAPFGEFLLKLGQIAKQKNKKVFLVNSTWENNPSAWNELINEFDGLYVRDQKSLVTLKTQHPHCEYAADLTFYSTHQAHQSNTSESTSAIRPQVIVNDSVYSHVSDALFNYAKKHQLDYHPITRELPLSSDAIGYNPKKMKKLKQYKLLSQLTFGLYQPRRYYQDFDYCIDDTAAFKQKMLDSDLVITGRYHCLCFCLQMQIPVLIVASNTSKTQNLLSDAGLRDRHIKTDDLNQLSLQQLLEKAQYSDEEKQKLIDFSLNTQRKHEQIFEKICA